jgi:LysR family transcriptional regulator, hydrogen peroxide-inducible genes activator
MTIVQLGYILAVEKYKSFQKASEHSFVTQPTLSMQIKKLEEELEVIIFDRSVNPVRPTTQGRLILDKAKEVVEKHDILLDTALSFKKTLTGEMRMGIIPTILPYIAYRFIPEFKRNYPNVNLFIDELVTEEITERIMSGDLDAGIMATPLETPGLIESPLYYEQFLAYVSQNHSLFDFEKLNAYQITTDGLWLLKDGHCFRDQVINLCHTDKNFIAKYDVEFRTDSFNSIIRLIDTEGGYTLLPEFAKLDLTGLQRKKLREFYSPIPTREVSLCYRRSFPHIRIIDALKSSILNNIPSKMKEKNGDIIPLT